MSDDVIERAEELLPTIEAGYPYYNAPKILRDLIAIAKRQQREAEAWRMVNGRFARVARLAAGAGNEACAAALLLVWQSARAHAKGEEAADGRS